MGKNLITLLFAFTLIASASWEMDFDDDYASASISRNWWDGLNMTAVWPINDGSGTNITEKIGNVKGSIVDYPLWTTSEGFSALKLDGTNDYITCGNVFNMGTNGVLISAWAKVSGISSASDYIGIAGKTFYGFSIGRYSIHLVKPNKFSTLYSATSAGSAVEIQAVGTTSLWINVCGVINRSEGTSHLYLDGVLQETKLITETTNNVSNTLPFNIGLYGNGSVAKYFAGFIRDVGVKYNGTTNDAVIIFNRTKATYGK